MCAIFGIYGEYNPKITKLMANCQKDRGPDKTSFYFNKKKKISIGMNRLAVIDKKNGNQPMISYDKKILTVFNGAIYNFKEIKNFLKKKSINFTTDSDTEVFVNSFAYWGDRCFNYFDGMWAAAFYDLKKNKIILSRDYLGQKPLYYTDIDKKIIFSSQLDGIFKYKKKFEISKSNLNLYYKFSHLPSPYTIYKNIHKLNPGEILTIHNNKTKSKIFWDLSNGPNYNIFFHKISKKNIKDNFIKNLKNYLIADKKLIIALSSGKDSQIINGLVNNIKPTSTITIGFNDNSFDESKLINKNKNSIIKILSKKKSFKIFNDLKKKIIFFNGDGSLIPTYFLFNELKKKTNVSLSGDGGDEIFFGYITFKAFYILAILKKIVPKYLLNHFKNIKFNNVSNSYIDNKKKANLFFNNIDKELYKVNSYWLNDYKDEDINEITNFKKNHKIFSEIKKLFFKHSNMRFIQLYYFKFYLPMILEKVDYASMLNSVENRSPFLNKDLINFSLSYDEKKNFNLFDEKKLMKDIFKESLEKKFKKIKKHGFSFQKSLILKNKKFLFKLIDQTLLLNKNNFHKKYKKYLVTNDHENFIWNELMLNISRQNLER